MFGISLDLSDLEKESEKQNIDFENGIKRLCMENPDLESQITTYIEQIRVQFEEIIFKEPVQIPDVFLKELDNPQWLFRVYREKFITQRLNIWITRVFQTHNILETAGK